MAVVELDIRNHQFQVNKNVSQLELVKTILKVNRKGFQIHNKIHMGNVERSLTYIIHITKTTFRNEFESNLLCFVGGEGLGIYGL